MKHLQKIVLLLIFLFCACCSRDPVVPIANKQLLAVPVNNINGLSNFAKVSETLYRGAQPDKVGFAELKMMGVKTVINLRSSHSDKRLLQGLGLQYVEIPLTAGDTNDGDVTAFLKIVTDPKNGISFVHCQHGSDRTGMMIAVYRMYVQAWTREDAIAELSNFGFHEIYKSIRRYLEGFDVKSIEQQMKLTELPKIEIVP
jgi:protein tyrosine/serine phosphatase